MEVRGALQLDLLAESIGSCAKSGPNSVGFKILSAVSEGLLAER